MTTYDSVSGALITDPSPRRTLVSDSGSSLEKPIVKEQQVLAHEIEIANDRGEVAHDPHRELERYAKLRPYILALTASVILGWWISSTVLEKTRHRWVVQTIWAWFFLLVIAFRFIPNRIISKPVGSIWMTTVQEPWYRLPYRVRLAAGWICLLAIVFGSAFGFGLQSNTNYGDRAISVLGLFVFQLGFFLTSTNRSRIPWPTTSSCTRNSILARHETQRGLCYRASN